MSIQEINTGFEPQAPPQILIMEDEISVGQGLKMILAEEGYGVEWSMTGKGAIDHFDRKIYDLLVADLRLPDMDGMDVIKRVKERRPDTEVVVITGYPSVASAVESARSGVRDYLRKPFTEDELKSVVAHALKEKAEASPDKFFNETREGRLIQKREVLRVLDRTSVDDEFWKDLMEIGSNALEGYQLSMQAKAAVISGDLRWINEHVGELTQKQLKFIYKRLEREVW